MSVLVYVENTEGKFKKSTFEAVSYAKTIAKQLNTQLITLSIGNVTNEDLSALGKYGAEKILNAQNDKLKSFINQAFASIITKAAEQENAEVVIMSNSFSAKGLAPRVAVKLQAGLIDNAITLPTIESSKFIIKRSAFSGKAFANVETTLSKKIITLAPNSYKLIETPSSVQIVSFNEGAKDSDFKTIVKEIVRASGKISLSDAELVVSGGRGLKGPENWGMIEELATLLGAATACSKPVADTDWRPHSEHVGQTGIVISPSLYIAIGISGAIQHLAGLSASKTIVVINNDPEAPFFKIADYGIVGDAFVVVPQLIEAIKEMKAL